MSEHDEYLFAAPEGYADLFDLTAEISDLDPVSGGFRLKPEPGVAETWQVTRKDFIAKRGYSQGEFAKLFRLVKEDVTMILELEQLDQVTPQDFVE